jgi:hypothetical protein
MTKNILNTQRPRSRFCARAQELSANHARARLQENDETVDSQPPNKSSASLAKKAGAAQRVLGANLLAPERRLSARRASALRPLCKPQRSRRALSRCWTCGAKGTPTAPASCARTSAGKQTAQRKTSLQKARVTKKHAL